MNLSRTTVLAGFLLALCFVSGVSVASEAGLANTPSTSPKARLPIVFLEAPVVVAGDLTDRFPQGSRLLRMTLGAQPSSAVSLTYGFFAVADPRVSFDGNRILFSGQQKRGDAWQIWEMVAEGGHPYQITHCLGDCLQPAYLPRSQILYTSIDGKGGQRASAVYVCQGNGTEAHPITFGPGDYQVEDVLRSGRVLVSANAPLLAEVAGRRSRALYTIRPDGSGLARLRQDAAANTLPAGADELADGSILFVARKNSSTGIVGGELAWIRPGALRASAITQPPWIYGSAHVLQEATLVVAKQSPGLPAAKREFDLYSFDLASKTLGDLLYRKPNFSAMQAVPLASHASPEYYWSILHPEAKTGRVLCLNSSVSEDAPHGRLAGRIAQVRVIALDQSDNHPRTLGEAPVETDGSFYVTVPADTPIRFELLGTRGEVVHAQRSWIWARTGEDRGCVGCHESNALAPENHWPLALRRSDTPTSLGTPLRTPPAGHP